MKMIWIVYCFFLFLPSLGSSQVLYDDFESPSGIRYHGSGSFRDTTNTLSKGLNISDRVGKYVKSGKLPDFINVKLNRKIADVSAFQRSQKKMYMYFYSSVPGMEVYITLLDSTRIKRKKDYSGKHSLYRAITKRQNQWELITFDFISAPDPDISPLDINKLMISIEPQKAVPAVYYFDEFYGPDFVQGKYAESR
jgi:hypothetical protein